MKKASWLIFLLFIFLVLFITNFSSGHFLSGWDNLQTEFDPILGLKRSFYGVWQEYQSFGLLAGMAHAADLVRSAFILILSFVLPKNIIRYVFHMLMLIIGCLGMFKFLKDLEFKDREESFAYIGALFYALNLGVFQIFFVPFEPFSIFFSALPWSVWIFAKLINTQFNFKNLLLFFLINLLATPQAYVQTIFMVYVLILTLFLTGIYISQKNLLVLKKGLFLLVGIIIINSFWILPQLYFLKTSGDVVKESKINQLATEDVLFQNKEKGTLANFVKMEGFYFDLNDAYAKPLFEPWKKHLSSPYIYFIGYLFFIISLFGVFYQTKYRYSLLLIFALNLIALVDNTLPFSILNNFVRKFPIINQVFRSPFTKFIIPHSFVMSYFFAAGIKNIHRFSDKYLWKSTLVKFLTILILLYSLPAFEGNFFSTSMKVKIPQEYFKVMDFFTHEDKNKRIALLPDYTFWGWFFHRWGYNGSGFLWYGIEQPIVSRTFDVWSNKSESYFWEIKNAIESGNVGIFEKIAEKYNIDYFLLDYSLLPVTSVYKGMQYDKIESILDQSDKISLIESWGDLRLYKVNHDKKIDSFISLSNKLVNAGPHIEIMGADTIYFDRGDYQTNKDKDFDVYYPFLDLGTGSSIVDKKLRIKEDENMFLLSSPLQLDNLQNYYLIGSSNVLFENNVIHAVVQKNQLVDFPVDQTKGENCGKTGTAIFSIESVSVAVKSDNRGINCFGYLASDLDQRNSYLVKVLSKNFEGRDLFLYITDQTKKESVLEDRLKEERNYFILSPRSKYSLGYAFNFRNDSYEKISSFNELRGLSVYEFPYDEIKNIRFEKKSIGYFKSKFPEDFEVFSKNYFFYKVVLGENDLRSGILILNQSFHPGWIAFADRKKLQDHVLVNNWANGWLLPDSKPVYVVFWPQILQFIGYILLLWGFIYVFKMPRFDIDGAKTQSREKRKDKSGKSVHEPFVPKVSLQEPDRRLY